MGALCASRSNVKATFVIAVRLASQLGPSGDLLQRTARRIQAIAELPDLLHCTLAVCLESLLGCKEADCGRLRAIAVERASHIAQHEPNPLWERKFWEIAAAFAALNKDEEAN
jgi:hypothetical protein